MVLLINQLIQENQHTKIIKESLVLNNISEKYLIKINPQLSLNLANSYFETGNRKEAIHVLKTINKESLSIRHRCFLSDILLKNNFLLEAEITIKKNKTLLFNILYNKYGANFYERLLEVKLEDAITKELVQFTCVNANTENKPYSLLHDFLAEKLKNSAHETFYNDLKNTGFKKSQISAEFKQKHIKGLEYFNLSEYYR